MGDPAQLPTPIKALRWLALVAALAMGARSASACLTDGLHTVHLLRLGACALLLVMALAARVLGPRLTLAGLTLVATTLALLLISPAAVVFTTKRVWRQEMLAEKIHRLDPRYVVSHIPGFSSVHKSSEFSVKYTIDTQGFRQTPTPETPRGRVTVLGCSFAFGHGVGDQQHFAAILGREHWPAYKVRNRAVMGWGPAQALLSVQDELARRPLPRVMLYGFIDDQLERTYILRSWLEQQAGPFPQFELVQGRPALKRYVTASEGLEPSAALTRKTVRLFAAMVGEMHRLSREKGVEFFLLLLPMHDAGMPPKVRDAMLAEVHRRGVHIIDLTRAGRGRYYKIDHHPTAAWHQEIARLLGTSPRLKRLLR